MFQSLEAVQFSTDELVFATVQEALRRSALRIDDVDYVIQNADDALEGIAIQHVFQVEAAGSFLKQETKLEGEPGRAIALALHRLKAGLSRCVLVVAYGKASQVDTAALELMATDPYFMRPIEATVTAMAGLQAAEFLRRTGLSEDHLCQSRALRHASDVEAVKASAPVALPLRQAMLPVYGDLCVALLLCTEDFAREKDAGFTAVDGMGLATATFPFMEFASWRTAEQAIKEATEKGREHAKQNTRESTNGTGITGRLREDNRSAFYLEFVDGWAHHEWMLAESLGLLDLTKPDEYLHGEYNINRSGFCVYVPPATGAARILAAHEALQGDASAGRPAEALVISSAGLSSVSAFHLTNGEAVA